MTDYDWILRLIDSSWPRSLARDWLDATVYKDQSDTDGRTRKKVIVDPPVIVP